VIKQILFEQNDLVIKIPFEVQSTNPMLNEAWQSNDDELKKVRSSKCDQTYANVAMSG